MVSALFYYTLGNFEPKYRSTLKTIQLIAVVTHPLLKEYGFECVLQPFIDDVNKLEKVGFSFETAYTYRLIVSVGIYLYNR